MKKKPSLLIFLLITIISLKADAQNMVEYPQWLMNNKPFEPAVTLYAKEVQQLAYIQNNKLWRFNLKGEQLGEPIVIRKNKGDLNQPRISPGGKSVSFFEEGESYLDDSYISVFNTDSNKILGRAKVQVGSTLNRLRFSGDSILHYYSSFRNFGSGNRWNLRTGNINRGSYYTDSAESNGLYELTGYYNNFYLLIRAKDTLAFGYYNQSTKKDSVLKLILLPNATTEIEAYFSASYPYLFINNKSTHTTKVYFFENETIQEVASWNKDYKVISADGSNNNCIALLQNSDGKYFIANTSNDSVLAFNVYNIKPSDIVETDATHNCITFSDATNGEITAYHSQSLQLIWQLNPIAQQSTVKKENTNQQQLDDSLGLFKVLIKQSSSSISNWQYDAVTEKMYVLKENQFISIDPVSQCAIQSETFNKEPYRMTNAEIIPGNRYVLAKYETWEKEPGARRKDYSDKEELFEDADKARKNYPYKATIYDRLQSKIVFDFKCKGEPAIEIINDSLISWVEYKIKEDKKTLYIYNLNSASLSAHHPFGNNIAYEHKTGFASDKNFYTIAVLANDSMVLLNANGELISTLRTKGESGDINFANFVSGGPFYYYNTYSPNKDNNLYQLKNDKATAVFSFPEKAEIVAAKANNNQCWIIYKVFKTIRQTEYSYTYLTEVVSKTTQLLDSTSDIYNGVWNSKMLIFPEKNLILVEKGQGFSWIDMQTLYEYKNFNENNHTIISLCYSPDGRYLAAANPDGKVMLWDLGTGKETRSLQVGTNGYITKLAFSGDGKYLAASSGDIWETASGKNVVSVTDGSIWDVNSIDFSKDGKRIISGGTCIISWDAGNGDKLFFQQYPGKQFMDTSAICFKPQGCVRSDYPLMVKSTAFHPDSKTFVTGNVSGYIIKWNTENDSLYSYQKLNTGKGSIDNSVTDIMYTRNGQSIIAIQKNGIYKLNADNLSVEDSLIIPDKEEILHIDMAYDNAHFGCIINRENKAIVQLRSLSDLKIIHEFVAEGAGFNKISFSPNNKQVATSSEDGFCTIWDLQTFQPIMYLNNIGEYGNVMVTPDNYYMASKSALESVGFFRNGNYYSFDQFDIYLNRPDIVLKRLGYASNELINFYHSAYLKRLKRNGGDSVINNNIPHIALTNKKDILPVTRQSIQALSLAISDSLTQKGIIQVYINGNPVIKKQLLASGITFNYTDSVELNYGANNIEVTYSNIKNVVSAKEKITVNYSAKNPIKSKIWFVGIGVSKYQNNKLNLKYPAKDIRDLATAFKKKYPAVIIDTLLNENASKENIETLHQKLKKTSVNDKIIVSFNGHGMLSDSLNWYFATYNINAAKPESNGLSYSAMENILSDIPARQKLLLIDACHSGEVDKEADITFANKETSMEKNVKETNTLARGNEVLGKSKAGLQTSFEMMQDLFANLNNSSGITVLSAAGGREYALESDEWKNGVFTYSILNALKAKEKTDNNADGKISVKELKKTVFDAVKKLTGGRQKPTSRLEVLDDWIIW